MKIEFIINWCVAFILNGSVEKGIAISMRKEVCFIEPRDTFKLLEWIAAVVVASDGLNELSCFVERGGATAIITRTVDRLLIKLRNTFELKFYFNYGAVLHCSPILKIYVVLIVDAIMLYKYILVFEYYFCFLLFARVIFLIW